jgi:hypothetical protein
LFNNDCVDAEVSVLILCSGGARFRTLAGISTILTENLYDCSYCVRPDGSVYRPQARNSRSIKEHFALTRCSSANKVELQLFSLTAYLKLSILAAQIM